MFKPRRGELVACPGCKRTDRFVLLAQFHSIDTKLVAQVEAVRLACVCEGVWDVSRSGAAVEVKPAREAKPTPPRPEEQSGKRGRDGEQPDSDLRGLFKRDRMRRA